MSALVVDTSAWVTWLAGRGWPAIDAALDAGTVALPPVVVAELASGAMSERKRKELVSFLGDLQVCAADFDHWVRVGRLRAALAARGLHVSTPDAHVAQCCLDLGGTLATEDAIFAKIVGVVALRLAAPGER